MKIASSTGRLAAVLQAFFLERLVAQRNASPQTVAAYRDSFRLLLQFVQQHIGTAPERLELTDLDAPTVLAFLDHLERKRRNTIRSRNARLAAIRSFAHFAALKDPTALPSLQGVLAIPMKRFDKPLLGFLSKCEIQAILNAPPADRWSGQRDRIMFATLYNTGARVSELTGLRVADVVLDGSACVHLHGKGRKDRSVPLWPTTTAQIRRWLPRIDSRPDRPLFPSTSGGRLARPAVTARLRLAVQRAVGQCPSLANRHISPHCVRHSTAMHMLQAGVDITVIALWLGHENPATTHMYVEADLAMKERALQAVQPPHVKQTRYRPTDRLLAFLQGL
ncbi:MAG TPA: tyrosine-type recombinase/integrase [Vicinamibacterales bacterium]